VLALLYIQRGLVTFAASFFCSLKNIPSMKILVCISRVPDTTTKISFTDNNSRFNEAGVQFIINPYDEWYALVRALELKETLGGTVTTITVDTAEADPVIRKALAIGADDAIRIDARPLEAFAVAAEIAAYAKDKNYDLILAGKETIDYNGGQVGGMVSALLQMPFVSIASKLEVEGAQLKAERPAHGGTELVVCDLPAVVSCAKGMAEQRIPNMRGIMAARTKKLEVLPATGNAALSETVAFDLPPAKAACKMVGPDNMDELVNLLHNEAKVI
jgi:electron transfer flavoprotein beta subunit